MYAKASTESSEDLIPVLNDSHMTIEEESGRSYVVLAEPKNRNICSGKRCRKPYVIISTIVSAVLLLLVIWLGVFNEYHKVANCNWRQKPDEVCTAPGCVKAAYKLMTFRDPDVDPCQDFFRYSCGGWLSKNRIPDNRTAWSVDSVLFQDNLDVLRRVLQDDKPDHPGRFSKVEKEARRFYKSCMNNERRNNLAAKPLTDYMRKFGLFPIRNMRSSKEKLTQLAMTLQNNFSLPLFFHLSVTADDKDSTEHTIKLKQAGLGLLQQKYKKNNSDVIMKAYLDLMTETHVLITGKNKSLVRQEMVDVLELEKNLSKIYVPMEKMTQIDEVYRKIKLTDLQAMCPLVDWYKLIRGIFNGIAVIKPDHDVVVYTSDFFRNLTDTIMGVDPRTLSNFVFWKIVNVYSQFLSDDFEEAKTRFVKVLLGSSGVEPRWKTCIVRTDGVVGMAVGAMFVRETFSESSKDEVSQMVSDIKHAFIGHLAQLGWMDIRTQQQAQVKANAMKEKIGFPRKILNSTALDIMYKGLHFSDEDFFANQLSVNRYELAKMLKKLGKKVDRSEWMMTPSTINAYYSPSFNEIVFPAGILQAPFYSKDYTKAVNFGGIGAIIGHELLHGFDNDGRLYDKDGNYGKTWWSRKSAVSFKRMSKCFIDEYSKFVLFGKNVNGKVTLGENIADNGGLKAAFTAYKAWTKNHGEEKLLPGLSITNDQAFFLSYGQSWCSHQRKGQALYLLDSDTHSPAKDRVLGTVSNLPDFAAAFKCPLGSPMNPDEKCGIW